MIEVQQPGFYTTVQDNGRFGYVDYGVPISGAMDRHSADYANSILKNQADAAVLEMTMTGAKLKFNIAAKLCITGAEMHPRLNDTEVSQYVALSIKEGDILSFGRLSSGFRTYVGIKGGFDSELKLGSRSMFNGITSKSMLFKNQELNIANLAPRNNSDFRLMEKIDLNENCLEVFEGPEFFRLEETQKNNLFEQEFTVSKYNNRMAYQLEEIIFNNLPQILTSPVLAGTVQLTPSGKFIILMRDCQTTGGYPRVLQLSEPAINTLSQKMAGSKISFKKIQ